MKDIIFGDKIGGKKILSAFRLKQLLCKVHAFEYISNFSSEAILHFNYILLS